MSDARRSDRTRAAILTAARHRFAADGYERATIRTIAADAYIDPSMVIRYFGSKDRLFDAAVEGAGALLPAPAAVPPDRRGDTLVRWFADCWREPYPDDRLLALFKSALYSQVAARRLRALIEGYVAALVPDGDDGHGTCVAVAAAQLYGAALYGYLRAADAVQAKRGAKGSPDRLNNAAKSDSPISEEFVAQLGAAVQWQLATAQEHAAG